MGASPVPDPATCEAAFHATITPHRALGPPHHLALAGPTLTPAVRAPLARAGAWPGLLFGVGEATLLLVAVALHRHGQDRAEVVTIAHGTLHIVRGRHGRAVDAHRLPVLGLRVMRVDAPEYACRFLAPDMRGRRVEIARDLSPDERPTLADAPAAALGAVGGSPELRIETRRSLVQHLTIGDAR